MGIYIKAYGARGSFPASGESRKVFGMGTSCFYVKAGGQDLVLDCGTGGQQLGEDLAARGAGPIHILLSHMHLDHIQGLLTFKPLFTPGVETHLYGQWRDGLDLRCQLLRLMSPPLWPVGPEAYQGRCFFHTLCAGESFSIGNEIQIDTGASNHPGESTLYRISHQDKSLVYALDYEHGGGDDLLKLAKGSDLVIYDAFFDDAEFAGKKGWGHSTWQEGVRFARESGVKKVWLAHLGSNKTDDELERLDSLVRQGCQTCSLAREGGELTL